jgi:hypothetical protein
MRRRSGTAEARRVGLALGWTRVSRVIDSMDRRGGIAEVLALAFAQKHRPLIAETSMRQLLPFLSFATLACAPSAEPRPDTTTSRAPRAAGRAADSLALLRLHARAREAHLAKRADWLVEGQADSLLSVSSGKVSVTPRERVRAGFQPYLDSSTFQAWDDVVPPRIRISPDGRMAYVVVEKRVHLTTRAPNGAIEAERTRFAWLSVYEKQGDEWRMTAIASTDRPDPL